MDNYTPPEAQISTEDPDSSIKIKVNKLPVVMFLHWIEDSFSLWFSLKWRILLGCTVLLIIYSLISAFIYYLGSIFKSDSNWVLAIEVLVQTIGAITQTFMIFISATLVLYIKDVDSNIQSSISGYVNTVFKRIKGIGLFVVIYIALLAVGGGSIYALYELDILGNNVISFFVIFISGLLFSWLFVFSPVLMIADPKLKVIDALLLSFKGVAKNIITLVLFAIIQFIMLIIILIFCSLFAKVIPFGQLILMVLFPFLFSYYYGVYITLYIQIFKFEAVYLSMEDAVKQAKENIVSDEH